MRTSQFLSLLCLMGVAQARLASRILPSEPPIEPDPVAAVTPLDVSAPFLYAPARLDQTGRQFMHFIYLDATAYRKGYRVGGVCPGLENHPSKKRFNARKREKYKKQPKRVADMEAVLERLGLANFFHYACPSQEDLNAGVAIFKDKLASPVEYLTDEWYTNFSARVQPHVTVDDRPRIPKKRVAVHVRRGDITPCAHPHRYLPNSFYLKALDLYLPDHCGDDDVLEECEITIYTQDHDLVESLDPFYRRGYTVDLNSTFGDIWRDFVHADVLMISLSAFSFGTALLNRNHVIWPARYIDETPMANWTVIEEGSPLRMEANIERGQLKPLCMENGQ